VKPTVCAENWPASLATVSSAFKKAGRAGEAGVAFDNTRSSISACIRTVIVDDDGLYRDFISASLSSKCNVQMFDAPDSRSMIDILDNNAIDCIILDYNLGVENGLSVGELIRKKYSDPPPFVMLTGEGGERTILKAFRGGFSDFVSKRNLNLEELIGAIRGAVDRKNNDRSDRAERNRLARLSGTDSLTGLNSRDSMTERAQELASTAVRQGGQFGVIVVRLGELESIGDRFGHVMRDRALRAFAARLRTTANDVDICGRGSNDSFLYLIDREARPEAVLAACERLSRDLSFDANFETASFSFTPRIGAAMCPLDGTDVEGLLAAANSACERACSSGVTFALASPLPTEASAPDALGPAGGPGIGSEISSAEPSCPGVNRQTNRRIEQRRRVLKRGKILTNGLESVVDCMLRDLSAGGAHLRVNQLYSPPDRFDLLFVDSGIKLTVDVCWRSGEDIGVRFRA
jgi:diguanylate cyclase (GGDEF)-like protein